MNYKRKGLVAKPLSIKELHVLEKAVEYVGQGDHSPFKKAIIEVYEYSPDDPYLSAKVGRIKRKLEGRQKDTAIFEICRIDKLRLASKLSSLLDAKKPIVHSGKIVNECDDNRTQVEAAKLVMNVLGLTQKGAGIDIGTQVNNIIVQMESVEDARKRVADDVRDQEIIQENYSVEDEAE